MWVNLLAFLSTFTAVFLKGFQHKNVIGGHLKLIAITSYFMAVTDVVCIKLVSDNGLIVVFGCGTGAALGMVISVKYHSRIVGFIARFKLPKF